MNDSAASPHPILRFFKRLLLTLLFLALAALTLWLVSERNARLFKFDLNDRGALVVQRGRHLPVGFALWTPQDLQLAQTYAPFVLDRAALATLDLSRVYAERDELDRVLFDLHREAVEQRAGNATPQALEEAVRLLQRAERLPGLSDAQKLQLRDLQIRTAFFEGRLRLQEAAALLHKALSKLRLATEGEDSRYADEATALLTTIQDSARTILNTSALHADQPQALPPPPPVEAPQPQPLPLPTPAQEAPATPPVDQGPAPTEIPDQAPPAPPIQEVE
ncbi:MAG: hypothetical protein LBM75_10075 [Myxococcales bacterium]|jgi:hypothetical protein|nr:hypothetical protein [Myxococcales bacterium]